MLNHSHSPLVQKPIEVVKTMDFLSAFKEVMLGKKMHKLEWEDTQYYGIIKDGFLMLHKPDGKFYQWMLSEADIFSNDWIVV